MSLLFIRRKLSLSYDIYTPCSCLPVTTDVLLLLLLLLMMTWYSSAVISYSLWEMHGVDGTGWTSSEERTALRDAYICTYTYGGTNLLSSCNKRLGRQ